MTHESSVSSSTSFLEGGGDMGARIRAYDWANTPLGIPEHWQQSLKTAVRIMITSRQPMWVWWGAELTNLYNDAYRPILGGKHPEMLGQPASVVWREIWEQVGPRAESVMFKNEATYDESLLLIMERNGYSEETYYTFSYSPIPNDQGGTGGILCANTDDTQRVISERQLALLRELATKTADARTFDETCTLSIECLKTNLYDFPFAMIYLIDSDQQQVNLSGTSGIERGHPLTPPTVELNQDSVWPFDAVLQARQMIIVSDLASYTQDLPMGAWHQSPHQAAVFPILAFGETGKAGILIVGLNPFRLFDDNYQSFVNLVTAQIAASIANAQAYEDERQRAETLAELDRAKTIFFSNVSHEFRTPLTLMLGPIEDALIDQSDPLSTPQRERIELVQRNGQRLLKLVNTLLDFSRIEAGRVQAVYEPTDLAVFTAELASVFRSAIERANLQLVIDCPPLPEAIYVDREMWEKIVLNLLSNAFKFTFTGEIAVRLKWIEMNKECDLQPLCPDPSPPKRSVILEILDTGIGIPAAELPHLFERFHRVKGAQGRSFEGSGIGLSLVQELIKLHQGTIEVNSIEGEGTCFAIAIPTGTAHLPQDRIGASRTLVSTASGVNAYVEEALRWLPEESLIADEQDEQMKQTNDFLINRETVLEQTQPVSTLKSPVKILLADDNADMRNYIKRLLSQQYDVKAVSNGLEAVAAVRQQIPDLVLTDVMMPKLDGFKVLQALRANPKTREVPIILLSARAGEEARMEGLSAGADDYLTKPFSGRELLVRVEASLKLAQLRREATQREQTLRLEAETTKASLEKVLAGIKDQFIVLDREWRYTFVNEQVTTITGKKYEEFIGQSFWDLFPDLIGSPFEIEVRRAVLEQTVVQVELFYPPLRRWFENRIYPFAEGVTIFVSDISVQKRAEQERETLFSQEQAAREEAERANRIKDEFLAVLSHELRSPLTPILGWAKILQSDDLDEDTTEHALSTIERNAKLQSELIEDLLDVSRILQGKLSLAVSSIHLAMPIQAALETVQLAAEAKSISIEVTLEAECDQVLGDSTRLQQVIWNLLSNAVKFTPAGGQVSVRLEQVGSEVQLTVSDTGKGISADFLPYVFEYFRQADSKTTRKFGGLGLGLAIVRHLIEMHGGTVEVVSSGEGLGSTFIVKLPLAPTQSESNVDLPSSPPSLTLNGIRVLIIDDDVDSRELLAFVLKQVGANVATAATPGEGLLALMRSPPDVLLSDIGMPDMDGYMLIQQVRTLPPEQGGQVKAIALTAYAGEANQQHAIAAGFQAHISKPISPTKLVETIVSVIEGHNNIQVM